MTSPERLSPSTAARVREAARAELRRAPRAVAWPLRAGRASATLLGFSLLALGVTVVAGIGAAPHGALALLTMAALVAAQAAGVWAVAAPFSRRRLGAALGLSAVALVMVAAGRALAVAPHGQSPDWVCSVTHLALDALPLALAVLLVRDGAWHPLRALAAGLAAGTVGLLVGEIGCTRGLAHVLVFHAGVWVALAAGMAIMTRKVRPRAYAP